MLSHWNMTTLEFTGAEFAFQSLYTAFKFLLPEFSVCTVRLKCTKAKHGTSSRISHQVCTQEMNPGALNLAQRARDDELPVRLSLQLHDLGFKPASGISGKPQALAALLSLLCRVCPAVAVWTLWLSPLVWHGQWEHKTSVGKQQQFQQPPLPLRAELHTGGPQNCRQSHFLCKSALKTARKTNTV